jgi:hypothetical protein
VLHEPQSSVALYMSGHCAHNDAAVHALRHVHTQLGILPETAAEWLKQSEASHVLVQSGYVPLYPALHAAQLLAGSYLTGHKSQRLSYHEVVQEQLQPVSVLPITVVAWLLQFAATVHVR